MGMRELGDWIRMQRAQRGLSQAALARAVGIARSYMSKIERGRVDDLGHDVVRNLAGALGVPVELLDDLRYDRTPRSREVVPIPEASLYVPIVVDLSAGSGAGAVIDHYEYVSFSEGRGRVLRGGRVRGDCMAPQIESGDTVIYRVVSDPSDAAEVPNGCIVVAHLLDDDCCVVKRFFLTGSMVRLEPNVGEPILVRADRVRIEGVVTKVIKHLER